MGTNMCCVRVAPRAKRAVPSALSEHESSDMDVDVEATVKKPKPSKPRMSDAVVDDLRSGRALHMDGNGSHRRSFSKGSSTVDREDGLHRRGDAATSLRLTGSLSSHRRTSSTALQRTESAPSLERTGSNTSYRPESIRRYSRTPSVAETDAEPDTEVPRTRLGSTLSRSSSRQSLVYAASEGPVKPAAYIERPGSAMSSSDRSTSASARPSPSPSIRTPSTRPASGTYELPPSVVSAIAATQRPVSSGMSLHPTCAGSENLRHLARGMEEELVKDMEAFMLDDMDEYMRSDEDAYVPPSPAPSLLKTISAVATNERPSSIGRASGSVRGLRGPIGRDAAAGGEAKTLEPSSRLRAKSSMRPPPAPSAARLASKASSASGMGVRPAESRMTAPRSLSSKTSNPSLNTKSSSATLGSRSSGATLAPKSSSTTLGARSSTMSAASSRTSSATSTLGSKTSTSTLRPRSSITGAPAPSLRATRPPVASSAEAPRSLRPRASTLGLFAPDGSPGTAEEPRRLAHKSSSASVSSAAGAGVSAGRTLRPVSSSLTSRGAAKSTATAAPSATSAANTASRIGTTSGGGTLSRTGSMSRAPAGSVASLRRR
jgi:hypothetical protein